MIVKSIITIFLVILLSLLCVYAQEKSIKAHMYMKELEQFKHAINEMKKQNINLRGFYHTSRWAPYWQDVLLEQLMMMDGKRIPQKWAENPPNISDMSLEHLVQTRLSILEQVDMLYLNVAGPTDKDLREIKSYIDTLPLKYRNNIKLNFNYTSGRGEYHDAIKNDKEKAAKLAANMEISEGESSTIMTLHEYCKKEVNEGRKAYIFYLHSKGGCCVRGKKKVSYNVEPVASWREGMNTFSIEFPSICLRALLNGYSTCGMELQDAHYSGNFWYANCDHIASLPSLEDRFDAWKSEFFVFHISPHHHINAIYANNCGYSSYKCHGVNHYDHECPRSIYRPKIIEYVSNYTLPPNEVSTISKDFNWVQEKCSQLRKTPYQQQNWWNNPDKFPLKE